MDWFEPSDEYQRKSEEDELVPMSISPPQEQVTSFDRIEEYEQNLTLQLLLNTDKKLYDNELQVKAKVAAANDDPHRYYSEGYEANYEGVDDAEIKQWQQHFPYLNIVGKSILSEGPERSGYGKSGNSVEVVDHFFESTGVDFNTLDLSIVGQKMNVDPIYIDLQNSHMTDVDSEEIIEQEGILEETIVVDIGSSTEVEAADDEEDVNLESMVKYIWGDVVKELRPLVEAVLRYADQNNISRRLEDLDSTQNNNANAFDDDDDDGW